MGIRHAAIREIANARRDGGKRYADGKEQAPGGSGERWATSAHNDAVLSESPIASERWRRDRKWHNGALLQGQ